MVLVLLCAAVPAQAASKPLTVTLSPETLTLTVNGTGKLSVKYSRSVKAKVEWTTDDPSVATVKGGKVTAVGPGECSITAFVAVGETNYLLSSRVSVIIPVTELNIVNRKVELPLGETTVPEVVFKPENATCRDLVWTTSNPNVATVAADGTITAISCGTAKITAKSAQGTKNKPSISMNVTVTNPVQKIDMPDSIVLNNEESFPLNATVLPDNAGNKCLSYTTSDKKIATVDGNGVVYAKGIGACVITAYAQDDSGVTAVCEVSVVEQATALSTSIASPIIITEGFARRVLCTITPATASVKALNWSIDNADAATISDEGLLSASAPGSAIVTASTTDGSNLSFMWSVIVEPVNPVVITAIDRKAAWAGETECLFITPANTTLTRTVKSFRFHITLADAEGTETAAYDCEWTAAMGKIAPGATAEASAWHWPGLTGLSEAARVGITVTQVTFDNGSRETIPDDRKVVQWFE